MAFFDIPWIAIVSAVIALFAMILSMVGVIGLPTSDPSTVSNTAWSIISLPSDGVQVTTDSNSVKFVGSMRFALSGACIYLVEQVQNTIHLTSHVDECIAFQSGSGQCTHIGQLIPSQAGEVKKILQVFCNDVDLRSVVSAFVGIGFAAAVLKMFATSARIALHFDHERVFPHWKERQPHFIIYNIALSTCCAATATVCLFIAIVIYGSQWFEALPI